MRITKQTIYCTLAVLFLLIAVVCGYLLLDSQHQKDEGRSAFRELASAVNEAQTTKQEAPDEPPAETENSLLAVYRALAEQNADMVGWIRIEGTTIDYPVMQTPDDFNFYLRRNFDKEYSNLGTPYIQENCDLKTSDNLILYGHHMLDGGMFSDLDLYKKKSFWEKHKTIRFDTLDEIAERNGTNVEQLLRLNPNLLPSDFVSGQVICLPTRRRVTEENTEEQET